METITDCSILLVDDEPELRKMVMGILRNDGFRQVRAAANCREARECFAQARPDGILLDVMLPDGDGFSLFREIRAAAPVPVLFLSARDEDENRLLGLGLGADDYITKPFLPRELILRLRAVLNRTYFPPDMQAQKEKPVFQLGETEIDFNKGTVRSPGGVQTLTAKEFILLEKLYSNRDHIVTGDSLCRAAWGDALYGYENTLMVHIRRLREKIEPEPSRPRYLLTVRGLGYRLQLEAKE